MKGVMVAAFDMKTDEELTYGERGEIRVNSPAHMKEYYKNPSATEKFFFEDKNGIVWGRTGDIGYVDEDGYVTILGRDADSFMAENDRKIYCFDIERVILQNENIALCEVVGLSMGDYEKPVAHLVLEKGITAEKSDIITNIHEVCRKELDKDSIPIGYKICDAFPVKNGKRDMEKIKKDREGFVLPSEKGLCVEQKFLAKE